MDLNLEEDHARQSKMVAELEHLIHNYKHENAPSIPTSSSFLTAIKVAWDPFLADLLPHLRYEESHITVVIRKYLNVEKQCQVTRDNLKLSGSY